MPQESKQKTYRLHPNWKAFFIAYVLSILTIPIGIGLIGLYYTRKKHLSVRYIISDTEIRSIDTKYEHHVDLVDISDIRLKQQWLQKRLRVGTLILKTSASEMKLKGLENPVQFQKILEEAVQIEKKRREKKEKNTPHKPKYKPGSMGKIDYLTGLWQQGLISNKDFKEERNHFE